MNGGLRQSQHSTLVHWFETLWLVTLASVPVSLRWSVFSGKAVVAVPLEVLVIACAVLLAVCWVREDRPDRCLLLHPISLVVIAGLLWTLVTSMTSVDPLVSLKYVLVRTAYLVAFFGGGMVVFARSKTASNRVALAGLAGFLPVVAWTLWHHASSDFSLKSSIEAGKPLYANHLEYGATLTFWLLVLLGLTMARRVQSGGGGGAVWILLLGFLPVLWAAHARSAWLALFVAFGAVVLRHLGVGIRGFVTMGILAFVAVLGSCVLYFGLNGPRQVEIEETVNPKPRVVGDASIQERLNRWSCAVRIAKSRPLVGLGPGTFEASYGVFQHHEEMSSHSSLRGDRGDAHSEYFSAFAEQGIVGLLMVIVLFGVSLRSGIRAAVDGRTAAQRWMALGWTAAVVSLAVGNLFNSFFEDDRVAPLMWLALAAIVVMERGCETTRTENR